MNWNDIVEGFKIFWEQPVPIIGFTVGSLISFFLVVFSKTTIGKRALNKITGMFEESERTRKDVVEKYEQLLKEKDEMLAQLTTEYENKLSLIQANKDREKEVIIAIAENIHNVKVAKIIEEYKQEPEVEEVSEYIESVKEEIKQEYESKYEMVLKQLEELKNGKVSEEVKEEI